MLNAEQIRFLLPALLVLPLAAAVILRFAEGQRAKITAIFFASLQLVLTLWIVFSAISGSEELFTSRIDSKFSNPTKTSPSSKFHSKVFEPHFVPGDPLINGQETSTTKYNVFTIATDSPNIKSAQFFIGLDGLNIWLIALSSVILFSVVLIGWDEHFDKIGNYFSWLFVLATGVIGVFLSFDLLMFYVFFELTLIPVLFLIGSWGTGAMRREAAKKLFVYTLAGGLITLLGIAGTVLFVYDQTQILTFSIPELAQLVQQQLHASNANNSMLWRNAQIYLFLALAVGFAVKIPLVPFHSWLPGAYSEAPTGVTVMLSALLAKMGTFGLLRVCLPLAPDATVIVGLPLLGVLASIGIIYGAFCAFAQSDARKLVAYSSISHLGFCVLGLLAFNSQGIGGSLLHMVNHGLSTGAMFILVGMIYRRYQTTRISDFGGLWNQLPVLTFFMMVIALASVGLPGLNNFISEMLMLAGLFDLRELSWKGLTFGLIASFGIFLSAWYTLTLTRRMFFGPLKEPVVQTRVPDVTFAEKISVGTLTVLCLLLGLFPQPVLDTIKREVDSLSLVAKDAKLRVAQNPSTK